MKSRNEVHLIGHVGKDPELKYTSKSVPVINVSIATNDEWTDSEGKKQERTEWHNLVAFSGLAEVISQHVKKGSRLAIYGQLQSRTWEKDGETRKAVYIRIEDMIFLDSKGNGTARAAGTSSGAVADDDIPF